MLQTDRQRTYGGQQAKPTPMPYVNTLKFKRDDFAVTCTTPKIQC